jgi:hypothetical protein
MSFTKELNLGSNKPMSVDGKPSINRYRSDNTSYKNNDWIRIEIPTGRNGQYIFPKDSFLEGSVFVNATNGATASAIYIDQSAYALFNRMRVLHGSTTIEDCIYVNKVWTSILDVQMNDSERRGLGITHMIGDNLTQYTNYNSGVYGARMCTLANAGAPVPAGANANESYPIDFCIPIPSAILGTLSQKALPIGLCSASSIYLELELASPAMAFVVDQIGVHTAALPANTITLNSFTVQNIYYNAKVVTLPNDVNNALIESTGGRIILPAVAYRAEQKSIAAGVTSFNDKFAFQYSSIKSFYFFVMNQTCAAGIITGRSITARAKANINDYYLTINGESYPSQSIAGGARMYAELLRSFDQLTDTNAGGIINYQNYTQSNNYTDLYSALPSTAAGDYGQMTYQQRFIAGIDLDKFHNSSDTLMTGTTTNGQLLSLQVNFSVATAVALNLYAFVMYDVMFSLEGGQLVAKT